MLDELVSIGLERRLLRAKDVVSILGPEGLEEKLAKLAETYGPHIYVECDPGDPPMVKFYGKRVVPATRDELERLREACRRTAVAMLRRYEEELAMAECRKRLRLIGGRLVIHLGGNLYADQEHLYVMRGGRLVRNMRWPLLYKKYLSGHPNAFVRWIGRKIQSELLPCLDVYQKLDVLRMATGRQASSLSA